MFKYRYDYKHLNLKINSLNIVIELSKDNTMGSISYSAKTNLMFQDEYGDWGHAVGVGSDEQKALSMCIKEIHDYTNLNIEANKIYEINLPSRITTVYKNKTVILYVKMVNNEYMLLTNQGVVKLPKNIDIIEYIEENSKKLLQLGVNQNSKEYFEDYNFEEPFENMTEKYCSK